MPLRRQDGLDVWHTSFGTGDRDALMLHCNLGRSAAWDGLAAHLGNVARLGAFDLPGHGKSGDWPDDDGTGDYMRSCVAIAEDTLGAPTDLIGHSYGGAVALRLADARPDLVRSLTLFEPVMLGLASVDAPEVARAYEADLAEYDRALKEGRRRDAAAAFMRALGDGDKWDAMPEAQKAGMARRIHLIEAGAPGIHEGARDMLRDGALGRIAQPVLLMEGSASPPIFSAVNDSLARRIGRATRAIIAGGGHMAPLTHPRQMAQEILRFWADHPA